MKVAAFLFLSSSLFLGACAQTGKKSANKGTSSTAEVPAKTGKEEGIIKGQPAITMLRMDRTACFGKCPTYYVEVKSDGNAGFHGIRFTAHDGVWEKKLSPAACQQLLRKFEVARVDTCADKYEVLVTDLPSVNYVFRYADGSAKNIQDASYGPYFLKMLAQEVDALVQVDDTWKQTAKTATYE